MKIINLVNNKGEVFVDDEDYEWLNEYSWYHSGRIGRSTAYAFYKGKKTNYKSIQMHRIIMEKYSGPSKLEVDHRNHNGFDNRKSNLRYATKSQNKVNCIKKRINPSSKYKGVSKTNIGKFRVAFKKDNRLVIDITFENEIDAAIAYDILAPQFHGEFVNKNFTNISDSDIIRVENLINNPKISRKKSNQLMSSKYIGVNSFLQGETIKWQSRIYHNGKRLFLGDFYLEDEAALAYNKKAVELFGNNTKLNIIND